jgi:hypothetical protein
VPRATFTAQAIVLVHRHDQPLGVEKRKAASIDADSTRSWTISVAAAFEPEVTNAAQTTTLAAMARTSGLRFICDFPFAADL